MSARLLSTARLLPLLLAIMFLAVTVNPVSANAANQAMQASSRKLLAEGLATSDPQAALFLLQRALVADPANASALSAMGGLYAKIGEPTYARKYYKSALRVDPTDAAALYGAARLDLADGDTKSAKARLDVLKTVCPTCHETQALTSEISATPSSNPPSSSHP
jgi:tetratricopeptide (TPR) repeat protein